MEFRNRSTNNYIPISDNEVASSIEGAINTVVIESPGSQYIKRPAGVTDDLPYYYCNIVGDGRSAVARVEVNQGSITEIRVVRPGHGYSYATLDFTNNRVYASLFNLDNEVNGLMPEGDGTFKSTVIISPPLGWGYNKPVFDQLNYTDKQHREQTKFELARQLGGTRVCVFSTLNPTLLSNRDDIIADTTFRQIGIIQDPIDLRTDAVSNRTISTCYAMKLLKTPETDVTQLMVGEKISQQLNNENTAIGQVVSVEYKREDSEDLIVVKYIQDPRLHTDIDGKIWSFEGNQIVEGDTSNVSGIIDVVFNDVLNDLHFVDGVSYPEVKRYTGVMTYVQNITPVSREPEQSERISLMVEY